MGKNNNTGNGLWAIGDRKSKDNKTGHRIFFIILFSVTYCLLPITDRPSYNLLPIACFWRSSL